MCLCVCVCLCVGVYTRGHACTRARVCVCVSVCGCLHVCTCVCVCEQVIGFPGLLQANTKGTPCRSGTSGTLRAKDAAMTQQILSTSNCLGEENVMYLPVL